MADTGIRTKMLLKMELDIKRNFTIEPAFREHKER